jgi:NAD(P)-dependent dehydrogenase (short-subunit alcohol dehydrogenase family)
MELSERMSDEQVAGFFNLKGKVALITGGGGALGGAIARGFAIRGADVALGDFSMTAMEPVAEEVKARGQQTLAIACDVVDEVSVQNMVVQVVEEFGNLDVLVTAAGIANRIPTEKMPVEEWQRIMDVNVRGTFLCCQKAGIQMIEQGGGKIITIGSVRGFQGNPGGYSGYTTSKAAVHGLTKQLATEWAKYKINVNSIAPALFQTPLTKQVLEDPDLYAFHMARIPWGRIAIPDDFVGAAIFLASDASDFMTGAILNVDGGWIAS